MQSKSRVRHHKTPSQKADLVAAYEGSGMSQREFAAQQGIALTTLQRWRRQSQIRQETLEAGLVEVPNLFGAGPAPCTYRLRFSGGLVLEVMSGFQPGELRCLAQLLQQL
jgi:hypothetical protein